MISFLFIKYDCTRKQWKRVWKAARGRWNHYQAIYLTNNESRNCADGEAVVILGKLVKEN